MTTCVFCGKPIEAGDERAGRPPMAAHAACADAALADDIHWDEVAARSGDVGAGEDQAESSEAQPAPAGRRGRAGCLTLVLAALLALAAAACTPQRDASSAIGVFEDCLERNGVRAGDITLSLDGGGRVESLSATIVEEGDVPYEPAVRLACIAEVEGR